MAKALTNELVLVGHPFAPIGMGEHLRASLRAFISAGARPQVRDIYGIHARDDEDVERLVASRVVGRLGRGVNVFHINGDEIENALAHMGDENFANSYNIIYPLWELSRYPAEWARQLERFDEVWAPSAFIESALQSAVSVPVRHMSLGVDVTMSKLLGRRYFGIPEHAFVFLFFFEFSSFIERKNPFAVLEAFEALMKRAPGMPVHCVIKFKGNPEGHPQAQRFAQLLDGLQGHVQIIDRAMSNNEIRNLVRVCDSFLSLHRAEGFGFGIAEAMALGQLAIATNYSGNLDFMTPETAFGVRYNLVPVPTNAYPHARGQVWADPSIDHAVALMEQAAADPALARAVGANARRHMGVHHSARATGLRYMERLRELREAGRLRAP